jgi:hypothetical protein
MLKTTKFQIATVIAVFLFVTSAIADDGTMPSDEPADRSSSACIPLNSIKKIQVVDDQTIRFHMLGGQVWENRLPYSCLGLKFEGGLEYKTGINRLCSGDMIRVVRRNTPCGLGSFWLCEESEK